MLGVVQTRELLAQMLAGKPLDVRANLRTAPVIPDTAEHYSCALFFRCERCAAAW